MKKISKEEALAMVSRQKESGLSVTRFAGENGISASYLWYWKRKVSATEGVSSSKFSPVVFNKTAKAADILEVRYPNGVVVRLSSNNIASLKTLINIY